MNIYIDCEWNEFRGALISMALVAEDGREWYECVACPSPGPWVAEHVMPILGKTPIAYPDFQRSLAAFLGGFDSANIVADWPEDISKFCEALIVGPGMCVNTPPLSFQIVRVDAPSAVPHNALWDARGIRDALTKHAA